MGTNAGITADDPITIKSDLILTALSISMMEHGLLQVIVESSIITDTFQTYLLGNFCTGFTLSINDFATGETDLATNGIKCHRDLYKHYSCI